MIVSDLMTLHDRIPQHDAADNRSVTTPETNLLNLGMFSMIFILNLELRKWSLQNAMFTDENETQMIEEKEAGLWMVTDPDTVDAQEPISQLTITRTITTIGEQKSIVQGETNQLQDHPDVEVIAVIPSKIQSFTPR